MARVSSVATCLAVFLLASMGAARCADGSPEPAQRASQITTSKAGVVFTGNIIADIAEKAIPAVVNIEVNKQVMPGGAQMQDIFRGLPFGFGFENFEFFYNGKKVNPRTIPKMLPTRPNNTGSGFVVKPDGYIVTNAHVVRDASKISVTFKDGKKFSAKVVGMDRFSDLAVIKIDANGLPTLAMGSSSSIRPGEFAIAIGNPLRYNHTVTLGIVSAVGRVTGVNEGHVDYIQTDAAINVGNSGGPLLNLTGEVIGVNSAVAVSAQNIGFAIPVDEVKMVSERLIKGIDIARPYLGIGMQELTDIHRKSLGLAENTSGVFVRKIYDGPAKDAGLKEGDIIKKIDGQNFTTVALVRKYVRSKKVGDTLNFMVLRDRGLKAMPVKIVDRKILDKQDSAK